MRVVIADDEPLARQLLVRLAEAQPGLAVAGVASDGESALELIRQSRPDLLFLDVKMPRMDGIDLAIELNSLRFRPQVVFVTAFDQFATRAFDLEALDYLVKPIARERFVRAVERARKAMQAEGNRRRAAATVLIRQRDELIDVREDEIFWLEAASQYVNVHTGGSRYMVAEPLSRFHARLDPHRFLRVHRSAVVNVDRVIRVHKRPNGLFALQLASGVEIPVSRSRRALVRDLARHCAENRRHA